MYSRNIFPTLIDLLASDIPKLVTPTLHLLVKFTSDDEIYCKELIKLGSLDIMSSLVNSYNLEIKKLALVGLSNFATIGIEEVEAIMQQPRLIEKIKTLMYKDNQSVVYSFT